MAVMRPGTSLFQGPPLQELPTQLPAPPPAAASAGAGSGLHAELSVRGILQDQPGGPTLPGKVCCLTQPTVDTGLPGDAERARPGPG